MRGQSLGCILGKVCTKSFLTHCALYQAVASALQITGNVATDVNSCESKGVGGWKMERQ